MSPAHATAEPGCAPETAFADEDVSAVSVVGRLSTLDRYLPLWIFVAMAIGLFLGRAMPNLGAILDRVQVAGVSVPIGIGLLG